MSQALSMTLGLAVTCRPRLGGEEVGQVISTQSGHDCSDQRPRVPLLSWPVQSVKNKPLFFADKLYKSMKVRPTCWTLSLPHSGQRCDSRVPVPYLPASVLCLALGLSFSAWGRMWLCPPGHIWQCSDTCWVSRLGE